jgi:hypothetical protein
MIPRVKTETVSDLATALGITLGAVRFVRNSDDCQITNRW